MLESRLARVDLSLFRFTSLVKWNYDRFVLGKRNTNRKGLVKLNFSRSTLVKRTFDKRFLAKRDSNKSTPGATLLFTPPHPEPAS